MKFETDERGDVIAFALANYALRTVWGVTAFLALDYARDDSELLAGVAGAPLPRLQLALTAVQARQLGQALMDAAAHLEALPPPGASTN